MLYVMGPFLKGHSLNCFTKIIVQTETYNFFREKGKNGHGKHKSGEFVLERSRNELEKHKNDKFVLKKSKNEREKHKSGESVLERAKKPRGGQRGERIKHRP